MDMDSGVQDGPKLVLGSWKERRLRRPPAFGSPSQFPTNLGRTWKAWTGPFHDFYLMHSHSRVSRGSATTNVIVPLLSVPLR